MRGAHTMCPGLHYLKLTPWSWPLSSDLSPLWQKLNEKRNSPSLGDLQLDGPSQQCFPIPFLAILGPQCEVRGPNLKVPQWDEGEIRTACLERRQSRERDFRRRPYISPGPFWLLLLWKHTLSQWSNLSSLTSRLFCMGQQKGNWGSYQG